MCKIALLVLCAQALLIQNAYGQCLQSFNQGLLGGYGVQQNIGNVGNVLSSNLISSNNGGFGGYGDGQLAVLGELPIGGNTFVEGNLPIIGVVEFDGVLPAIGFVSVVGSTPCECGGYSGFY